MDRLLRSCVAELLATFVFVFVAAGAICVNAFMTNQGKPGIGIVGICLAGGIAYAVVVTATMHISGGHANPAITLGLWFAFIVLPEGLAVQEGCGVKFSLTGSIRNVGPHLVHAVLARHLA